MIIRHITRLHQGAAHCHRGSTATAVQPLQYGGLMGKVLALWSKKALALWRQDNRFDTGSHQVKMVNQGGLMRFQTVAGFGCQEAFEIVLDAQPQRQAVGYELGGHEP